MKKYTFTTLLLACWLFSVQAQVGINILNPDPSAALQVESSTRGFLPPRLTETQRDAIVAPLPGLQIFNSTDSVMEYYNGICWLKVFQRDCNDCVFNFTISDQTDSIDRILTNSCSTTLNAVQLAGANNQSIAFFVLPNLPAGMTATLSNYTINGSGSSTLTVTADIFTTPGTYTIIVQAVCNATIASQVYIVTVEPCFIVDIVNNQQNYNLQSAAGLPTAQPICVVANIFPGVNVENGLSTPAAFNVGALHPQSQVGIRNNGNILGHGGNGGFGGNFTQFGTVGGNGTNALNLTTATTTIINTGTIYGGGGGGGSVGVGVTIPVVNINLGVGAGGGGGAQLGLGGAQNLPFPTYANGQNATGGVAAVGGNGGLLNFAIPIPIGPVQVTLTPNAFGGDGGDYGQAGTAGSIFVNVVVSINVPFIGTVNILNTNIPNPPPSTFPAGGTAGYAVKRNGGVLNNLPDGNYNTLNVKGQVGN